MADTVTWGGTPTHTEEAELENSYTLDAGACELTVNTDWDHIRGVAEIQYESRTPFDTMATDAGRCGNTVEISADPVTAPPFVFPFRPTALVEDVPGGERAKIYRYRALLRYQGSNGAAPSEESEIVRKTMDGYTQRRFGPWTAWTRKAPYLTATSWAPSAILP